MSLQVMHIRILHHDNMELKDRMVVIFQFVC